MIITGAIFDIDGTLIDSMKIWDNLGERYLLKLGIQPKANLSRVLYPMTLNESCLYLKNHYSLTYSTDKIKQDLLKILNDFYYFEVPAKKGVNKFLAALKKLNIPMVLATSGNKDLAIAALKRLNLLKYFEAIFTCDEMQTTKKEPYIFNKAAHYINSKPHHTLVFEDNLDAINTAKENRFITIAIEDASNIYNKEIFQASADYYLSDYSSNEIFTKYFKNNIREE